MTENSAVSTWDAFNLGPIDILVLEFPGVEFRAEVVRNLTELVEAGTIRIIDLVVIKKSQSGLISALELSDLGKSAQAELSPLRATISQMLTNDDINEIGKTIDNNTTAAVLLYENTWALKLKQALLATKGRFIASERIPHNVVVETLRDMAALGGQVQ